jgi:hypothetical protein
MNNAKKKMAIVCLALGMFFLPIGFDIAFYMVLQLTSSYLATTGVFYLLSACFFGFYFFFSDINVFNIIKNRYHILKSKIIGIFV